MRFSLCALSLLLLSSFALAEQKQTFGTYEVHYIVVPTTFLNDKIAAQYDLTRGKDRALVNISVLDESLTPVPATVNGSSRNLLEQQQEFEFNEVREGTAIYYLALMRHGNEEHRRFSIEVVLPDGEIATLNWQQKMYWEE